MTHRQRLKEHRAYRASRAAGARTNYARVLDAYNAAPLSRRDDMLVGALLDITRDDLTTWS